MKGWILLFLLIFVFWLGYKIGLNEGSIMTKFHEHQIYSEGIKEGVRLQCKSI